MTTPEPLDLSLPQWRDDPQLLKAALIERLDQPVVIDADLSRPLDTLTAQTLLAAHRVAQQSGHVFELRNPSDAVRNGLRLLGLDQELLGQGGVA